MLMSLHIVGNFAATNDLLISMIDLDSSLTQLAAKDGRDALLANIKLASLSSMSDTL
jgi:hypothetical protein